MEIIHTEILSFGIGDQRFAVPLASVECVVRAMEVTPVPDAPAGVYGVIDYHGELVTVINLHNQLKMPGREIRLNDRFIIANTAKRKIALVVETVLGILSPREMDVNPTETISTGLLFDGILCDINGIILIYNVEKLLQNVGETQPDEQLQIKGID